MSETKQEFTPDFLIVPKETMSLPPADRFVFGVVYFMERLSLGKCIASNVEIGRIAGVKAHSVTGCLDRLESKGLIKRTFKDDNKRHRDQIICLIGFGKLESSGVIVSSPLVKTLESSRKGHIKNTIKNTINIETEDPSVEFKALSFFKEIQETSSIPHDRLIAYFVIRKQLYKNCSTKKQALAVIARHTPVAKRLKIFENEKILKVMDTLDDLLARGKLRYWGLEMVEQNLLGSKI